MRNTLGVTYLHGNHLGSASLTTGATNNSARYLPFGGTRWESGATPTDFQFTGQRKEAGFGLYDYHARYYDPLLGRFISPDTIVPDPKNPVSYNRYMYVGNNPLRHTDPDGHCWPICTVVAGIIVGGVVGAGISIGTQMWKGQSVDWAQVAGSTAAGAAFGGLMGLAGPAVAAASTAVGTAAGAGLIGATAATVTEVGLSAAAGYVAGSLSGQVGRATTAEANELGNIITGKGFDGDRLRQNLRNEKFGNLDAMQQDGEIGAKSAAIGVAIGRVARGLGIQTEGEQVPNAGHITRVGKYPQVEKYSGTTIEDYMRQSVVGTGIGIGADIWLSQ